MDRPKRGTRYECRRSQRNQDARIAGGHDPGRRRGVDPGRPLACSIQSGAGQGSGISDEQYAANGAEIVADAADVWRQADLIVKVKEPLPVEWPLMRPGQIVFTYFHFAADEQLTRAVMQSGITAIAYETIRDAKGNLPLLTPMSEVAGRMSIQEGAKFLERPFDGRGILLGGVPGVLPANVVILGGGVVGANAAKVAAGLGANVTILDINLDRLRYLDDVMPQERHHALQRSAQHPRQPQPRRPADRGRADSRAPAPASGASAKTCKRMPPRAVIIDVAIDQGGCVETSRPTTHSQPTYIVDDVVHYCVTNMPGAVGRTSTYALTNVTLPYVLATGEQGIGTSGEGELGPGARCQHLRRPGDEFRGGGDVRAGMCDALRYLRQGGRPCRSSPIGFGRLCCCSSPCAVSSSFMDWMPASFGAPNVFAP